MHVLVIGATKGTGASLVDHLLADPDAGHRVRALVRDPDAADARALVDRGVEVVVGDLGAEDGRPIREAVEGVDAVAFCAGSGSSTGKDQTLLVDLHGAVRSIDAAVDAGVERYVMLSSMAADDPWRRGAAAIAPYLAAKHAADRILAASDLDWSIVRPGGLTHADPAGRVVVGQPALAPEQLGERTIARADVAAVLAACLTAPAAVGATFEVLTGDTPVADAVDALQPCGPTG